LAPGQLHETNGLTLRALATLAGADVMRAEVVPDTEAQTRAAIEAALSDADVLVLSGGVSVGPHDHVKPALEALGVEQVFWRVALRPGRPTWFGTRGETLVFGLPGNPVSAMVTFLLFARPALAALQGAPHQPERLVARLGAAIPRHADRDECVRVTLRDGVATPTGPQGSHQLRSMLGADGLAIVPAGEGTLEPGAEVEADAPAGSFTIAEPEGRYLLVAGGIGITPFRAIFHDLDHRGEPLNIRLLYANRNEEIPFREEFEEIASRHPELSIEYVIEPDLLDADRLRPEIGEGRTYWVSGPKPMVDAVQATLIELGAPEDVIKRDAFPGYD
jgi:molybdenum cofactor synthesis domain-containing protein